MPIPEDCWKANNHRQQNRYMMILLSGIASFIGSVIFVGFFWYIRENYNFNMLFFPYFLKVAKSGKMELNYTVPDYPYEEEVEE